MFAFLSNTFNKFFPYLTACMARRRETRYAEREISRRKARFARPRLEVLEGRIVPDAYTWAPVGASTDYTDRFNWYDNTNPPNIAVPGSGDTADIPSGSPLCALSSTTAYTVAGLTVEGGFSLGSKLSVTTMTTSGTFDLPTGGELDVLGSADFGGGGTLQGQVDAQGSSVTFDPTTSMVLGNGVQLTGSGVFNIYGPVTCNAALSQNTTMVLDSNGSTTVGALLGSGSLTESGEFDWNGGAISLPGGTSFIASADLKLDTSESKVLYTTLTNQCNGSTLGGDGALNIVSGTFDNLGNPNCIVTLPNIYTFNGGSFINDADGFFDEEGDTLVTGNFVNNGTILGGGTLTLTAGQLDGTLMLDGGTVIVAGSMTSPTGVVMGPGSGTLDIGEPDASATGTLTVGSGYEVLVTSGTLEVTGSGTLTGGGTLDNNSGTVQLDAGSTTMGLGAFIQTSSGQLILQLASPFTYGSLTVTGNANLGGTLGVTYFGGYMPSSGTVFTALTAGSITHEFNVTPSDMTADYGSGTVTLTEN